MAAQEIPTVEKLLRIREARGLRVPVTLRILFSFYGLLTAFTAPVPSETRIFILCCCIPYMAANVYFLTLLREEKRVELVGIIGIVLDTITVLLYPFILYDLFSLTSMPLAMVSKWPLLAAFCLIFIVIESLALRPLYPLIITGAAVIMHLGMIFLSIDHPAVTWAADTSSVFSESVISLTGVIHAMIFILIAGSALTWLTWAVRKTVIQAAELEAERFQIAQQQANLLMESRIGVLGELVAGISHEMNNPLGAVKANAETGRRAAGRIRESLRKDVEAGPSDDKVDRILDALERNSSSTLEATQRLETTLKTLRSFARMDEAEFKEVDIHEAIDSTLALIPPETLGSAEIKKEHGDLPEVQAYAGRLNQIFMTLLTRAFDAVKGQGTVTIATGRIGDEVSIRITDTGPPIPVEQRERIFDIRMQAGETRVAAGFGMAACRSIVNQHGGRIQVESSLDAGTTFTIVLPVLGSRR